MKKYLSLFTIVLISLLSFSGQVFADQVDPTITIIGDNPFLCRVRYECPDLGAVAVDSLGNKLFVSVSSNVRANTVGNYTIVYSAQDSAGHSTTVTRRVNVSTRSSGLSSTTIDASSVAGLSSSRFINGSFS